MFVYNWMVSVVYVSVYVSSNSFRSQFSLGLDQTAWFELTIDLFIMFTTCYKDYCAFKANVSHVPELNSTDEADRNVMPRPKKRKVKGAKLHFR